VIKVLLIIWFTAVISFHYRVSNTLTNTQYRIIHRTAKDYDKTHVHFNNDATF